MSNNEDVCIYHTNCSQQAIDVLNFLQNNLESGDFYNTLEALDYSPRILQPSSILDMNQSTEMTVDQPSDVKLLDLKAALKKNMHVDCVLTFLGDLEKYVQIQNATIMWHQDLKTA